MQLRTVLLLVILVGIAAFAAVNWSAFTTPAPLSLVVTTIQAPLGLIMLALIVLLSLLFLVFVVYLQTSVLLESRRNARELQAQRALADQAEASRFTELRGFIETQVQQLENRIEASEARLQGALEQSGNTLAAYIGELEDRLETQARLPPK